MGTCRRLVHKYLRINISFGRYYAFYLTHDTHTHSHSHAAQFHSSASALSHRSDTQTDADECATKSVFHRVESLKFHSEQTAHLHGLNKQIFDNHSFDEHPKKFFGDFYSVFEKSIRGIRHKLECGECAEDTTKCGKKRVKKDVDDVERRKSRHDEAK